MAYGDAWGGYPWGNATLPIYTTAGTSATMLPTVWYGNTSGQYYDYQFPAVQAAMEKVEPLVESAMDWLRRRVTEITDLAYEGV